MNTDIPTSPTPLRDLLASWIRAGLRDDCGGCAVATCAVHAAEAILNAARREGLFILDRASADEVTEQARADERALFVPVAFRSGEALFLHRPCRQIEWWHEGERGPINEQGCDCCESAPDGQWVAVYVRKDGPR